MRDRFKLFECTVTPCALYAGGTWNTTVKMEHKLITIQRRMIRWTVSVPQGTAESWPDFIQRATHRSEELASKYGAEDWASIQKTQKWRLAGKAAMSTDGRWTKRFLEWKPWFRTLPHRDVGRPLKRWDDDLTHLIGGGWPEAALDGAVWQALGETFAAS